MAEPLRRAAGPELGPLDGLPRVAARAAPPAADLASLIETGEPVVLKGVCEHWPARAAGRAGAGALAAYLKGLDRGGPSCTAPGRWAWSSVCCCRRGASAR